MANYSDLKAAIDVNIRNNGNGEITGDVMNQVLKNMVNVLGGGYQFAGAATTGMNPGTPDNNVYYVTTTAGTYTNFGGLVVNDGELALLTYNGTWQKVAVTLPAGGGGGSITVDSELNETSTNPVQNAIITQALGNKTETVSLYVPAETDEQREHNLSVLSKIAAGGVVVMASGQVQLFLLEVTDTYYKFTGFVGIDQMAIIDVSTETGAAAIDMTSFYESVYFMKLNVLDSPTTQLSYIAERLANTYFLYTRPFLALPMGAKKISNPMYIDWEQGIFIYRGDDNITYQRQYNMSTGELIEETILSPGGYPTINITTNTQQLSPNTYYTFTGSDLTISLLIPTVNVAYEYVIKIVCTGTPNITLPDGLVWANDTAPVFTAGKTYVISIIDNLAVFAEFTTAS